MRLRERLTALAALILLAGLLVGMPILLLAVGALVRPPATATLDDILAMLLRPDDGTLALVVFQALAWACWALLVALVVVEIAAHLRHVTAPRIRVIAGPQAVVRSLVATAATLFLGTATIQPIGTAIAAPITATPHDDAQTGSLADAREENRSEPASVTYTVRPGDSLWSIAQRHLGAGERYPEIVALNPGRLTRPDFLQVGWTLTLPTTDGPASNAGLPAGPYVVQKGDTLRRIAQQHLGDADRYTEIFDASTGTTQPDGRRLADPHLIHPGWLLNLGVPTTAPSPASGEPEPTGVEGPEVGVMNQDASVADGADSVAGADAETVLPSWALVGLTGAGAGLAASLFVMLRRRRASQHRWRRPGRSIALPPPDLADAEKTIVTEGARAEASIEVLDGALRTLVADQVADGLPIPDVAAVELTPERFVLHLTDPCTPSARWEADGAQRRWQAITLDDLVDQSGWEPDAPAPYPQLVTIGAGDDGACWLLNLEIAGIITLTGDPARVDAFLRFVIAELAANSWSRDVHVDCLSIGDELERLEPRRVSAHPDLGETIDRLVLDTEATLRRLNGHNLGSVHTARALGVDDDLWDSRVLIIDNQPAADLDELLQLVDTTEAIAGTSIVRHGAALAHVGEVIELTTTGRLRMPGSGLDLAAVGLTSGESDDIAGLLNVANDWNNVPIPAMDAEPGTWQQFVDHAGHLHTDLAIPRAEEPPAEAASLLPEPDDAYLEVAATTTDDLATLAPHIPADIRDAVEAADPDLDADLERWRHDPDTPKLTILGPIKARVGRQGRPAVVAKRQPYYTEMLIYLATRPHGATTEEAAEAFGISTNRVRKDISVLREWLGTNPRTGQRHIPEATRTRAAQRRGVGAYEVEGLLVDADLFRRLRARGEARGGEAGIQDLQAALDLVSGEPLSLLKDGGRPWLADGPRLDQHLICAIVDVAHVVVTHALREGDHQTARRVAELADRVAPDELTPQADLAAVTAMDGRPRVTDAHDTWQPGQHTAGQDDAADDLPERVLQLRRQSG